MSLPLRLWAEAPLRAAFYPEVCFLLPSVEEEECCVVICEQGLAVLALSSGAAAKLTSDLSALLGLRDDELPAYWLVREGGLPVWFHQGVKMASVPASTTVQEACKTPTPAVAERMVAGINRYYSRQILEPAIRGFLSILGRQFPRNDLYLYELLQNAVDDGALHVKFRSLNQGLLFCHDGKPFSATDVLGLASVGLSTKGASGKRTIGFMGIGFKACYKKFRCVKVFDSTWAFKFEEPSKPAAMAPPHGWVLQPLPCPAGDHLKPDASASNWCHFQLEGVRGNSPASKDLDYIARSVPALLGRQAILNSGGASTAFVLEWGRVVYDVSVMEASAVSSVHGRTSQKVVVIEKDLRTKATRTINYQFLTVAFKPDGPACASYFDHTKRKWGGGTESTSLFFETDSHGSIVRKGGGKVHAVLPVHGVQMPTVFNFQGPWLLSVDRQDMQSLSDNAWNICVLHQTPELLCGIAEWIASTRNMSGYCLFPEMRYSSMGSGGGLSTDMLGQTVSLNLLESFFRKSPVIPVATIDGDGSNKLDFVDSSRAMWLPPAFVAQLPVTFLKQLVNGRSPFAAAHLGTMAYHTLWKRVLLRPTVRSLQGVRVDFGSGGDAVQLALGCLAALATTVEEESSETERETKQKGAKPTDGSKDAVAAEKWLPSVEHWPVFLSTRSSVGLRLKDIIIPAEDFADLSVAIHNIVQPALGSSGRPVLHADLEKALREGSTPMLRQALKCLVMAREAVPDSVMGVDAALNALHCSWARVPEMSDELVGQAVSVFTWAHSEGRKLSHLLTEGPDGKFHMVPSYTISIGKAYFPDTLLEDMAAYVPMSIVSKRYIESAGASAHIRAKYARFLVNCGAHRGLAFEATSRRATKQEESTLGINFRSKNTAVPLTLPYRLGPLTKKYAEVVDVSLTRQWKDIVVKASKLLKPAAAVAQLVCDSFGESDSAEVPTHTSTPAAAKLIQGKAEEGVAALPPKHVPSGTPVPVKARAYYLPAGQPGASAATVGDSSWLQFLSLARWVPAAPPGSNASAPATMVLRPCEVGLPGCEADMPQIRLPARALTKLMSVACESLKWGTKKPPPPVDELEEIAEELVPAKSGSDEPDHKAYHGRLVLIWKALSSAHTEGRLSSKEQIRITKAVRAAPLIPKDDDDARLYSFHFLVDTSREVRKRDGHLAAVSLVAVGFVYDLCKADEALRDLLMVPGYLSVPAAKAYVNHCAEAKFAVTAEVSAAYSHALWCVMGEQVYAADTYERRPMTAGEKKTCADAVNRAFPSGLRLFCQRGPGIHGWPARWIPHTGVDDVLPVVMDEMPPTPSGVLKKTLLGMQHEYQPLGMLWTRGRSDEAAINRIIVQVLEVAKLSTFKLKIQTKGKRVTLDHASDRLAVVLHLLQYMSDTPDVLTSMPVLAKFDAILLHFSTPRLSDPQLLPTFTVWGGSARPDTRRPLFVSGQPEDYGTDVGELVATTFGRPTHGSASKAFRLLFYLEDAKKFDKFLNRDFSELIEGDIDSDASPLVRALRESTAKLEPPPPEEEPAIEALVVAPLAATAVAEGGRGAGRGGAVNLPAWMTGDAGGIAAPSAMSDAAAAIISPLYVQPPPLGSSYAAPITTAPEDGRGAGRGGVMNLPAWMTGDAGDGTAPSSVSDATVPAIPVNQLSVTPPLVAEGGRGAGRGAVNLPAWMTDEAGSLSALAAPVGASGGAGDVALMYVQPPPPEKSNPLARRFETGEQEEGEVRQSGSTASKLLAMNDTELGKSVRTVVECNPEIGEKITSAIDSIEQGKWTKHTSGFGSAILQKHGFTGRLGSKEDGIALPVTTDGAQTTSKGLGYANKDNSGKGKTKAASSTPYGPPAKTQKR